VGGCARETGGDGKYRDRSRGVVGAGSAAGCRQAESAMGKKVKIDKTKR
jgi:hypothetical protein